MVIINKNTFPDSSSEDLGDNVYFREINGKPYAWNVPGITLHVKATNITSLRVTKEFPLS